MKYPVFLAKEHFQSLIDILLKKGFECIAPVIKEKTIQYQKITHVSQIAIGINDKQKPADYKLIKSKTNNYFDWSNGPQAFKPFFFKAEQNLWKVKNNKEKLSYKAIKDKPINRAFIGVKSCDLAALVLQDQHFLQHDIFYANSRKDAFIIAVNCSSPSENCFCHSTGDGPECKQGFDILLTELTDGFILESGTLKALDIIKLLTTEKITEDHLQQKSKIIQNAITAQKKQINIEKIRQGLKANSAKWSELEQRCLSCGNCTMVCPTCFCYKEQDLPELGGKSSTHQRLWDSCFSDQHSYMGGNIIHLNTSSKYRQWLMHKFVWWFEQYGRSGCVGCGRCITWCPAAIDLTKEAKNIAKEDD